MTAKNIESIRIYDFIKYPVWKYVNSDINGELLIKPIKKIPVENTSEIILGLYGKMNNGTPVFSMIGNYSHGNEKMNKHFITISLWINGSWFHLARYHDIDYAENGPMKLCTILKLEYKEIFPIKYNLHSIVKNAETELQYAEPKIWLTRQEIIAMSLE